MAQEIKTIEAIKEEIRERAIRDIMDELEDMDAVEFCELANDYGDSDTLYTSLGDMFDGERIAPIEAYEIGRDYGNEDMEYATYFRYGWGGVETYDDKEDAQDLEQMAEALLDDDYFEDIAERYHGAIEEAEELERERLEQEEKDEECEEKTRAIIRLLAQVHDLLDINPNATLEDIARVGATIIEVTTKEV